MAARTSGAVRLGALSDDGPLPAAAGRVVRYWRRSAFCSPARRERHRRIAIGLLAGTLNSAGAFFIAAASSGAATALSQTALLGIL
jgi:hypothetical protein